MKKVTLIIFIIISQNLLSQNNPRVETSYPEYFKYPRESFFMHLNKTSFLQGEEVWFKVYRYNKTQKNKSDFPSNVYVSIYDENGKQLQNKVLFSENGTAYGNFNIDSTFTSKNYYVKAYSSWSKNFTENESFIQKIKILTIEDFEDDNSEISYDIQFLPESGHFINNTKNCVGFKVIDDKGLGVKAQIAITDSEGYEITSKESNHLGMGKFFITPRNNETYTVEVKIDDFTVASKTLPKAEESGITMSINNESNKEIILSFYTNNNTFSKIKNEKFKLAIHRDGMMKTLPFFFDNKPRKSIALDKSVLLDGINIFTLFDSKGTPICERMAFKPFEITQDNVFISQQKKDTDSITFSIYQSKSENANLSISILPRNNLSYNTNHNIISAFLLKPYVKGFVESPKYYFTNTNKQKENDLDLLLLTQGWSKYDWKNIFNNSLKNKEFINKNGITLTGNIVGNHAEMDSLYLYPTTFYPSQFISLKNGSQFKIPNFLIRQNEVLKFAYVNKKMQLLKPNIDLKYELEPLNDSTITLKDLKLNDYYFSDDTQGNLNPMYTNTQTLDEIELVGRKKREKIKYESFSRSFKKNTTYINEQEGFTYPSVTDYIRSHGYNVSLNFGKVDVKSRIPLSLGRGDGSKDIYPSPSIFIDDVLLQDFTILYELPTANIEKIYVDKAGLGQGLNEGAAGVIRIYLKQRSVFDIEKASENVSTYFVSAPKIGFSEKKSFYIPLYSSYQSSTFKNQGTIGWFPDVELKQNVSNSLKVLNTSTQDITFYVEGINNEGQFISKILPLKIK